MPYDEKAVGAAISRKRIEKGLSQEILSALAGISRSHLSLLENGKKTVMLDTFWRIADALEIKPSELLKEIEGKKQ